MAKINPNFSSFFQNAVSAGFGSNEIISFMQNLFHNPSQSNERSRLQSGGGLRPDEEEASSAIHRAEEPERIIKGAAKVAGTIGGIGLAASKIPGLVKSGLAATSTKKSSKEKNKSSDQKEEPSTTEQVNPSESKSKKQPLGFAEFIKQYPELGNFFDISINHNGTPIQDAVAMAREKKLLNPIISRIEKDIGQSMEEILSQFFQGSQKNQQQAQPEQTSESRSDKQARIIQLLKERMARK